MSVPSDDPDDWMNLESLKIDQVTLSKFHIKKDIIDSILPISIIKIEGYGDFPAKDIIDRFNISSSKDPKLEHAKK